MPNCPTYDVAVELGTLEFRSGFSVPGLEWILGLQIRADKLVFDPCIPIAYRSYSLINTKIPAMKSRLKIRTES